jgi:hypothetical protein
MNEFLEECKNKNLNPKKVAEFKEFIFNGKEWVETGKVIKPSKEGE